MAGVHVSKVIEGPIEEVWDMIRPFNSFEDWYPGAEESVIEDGMEPDQVGAVRNTLLESGTRFRERMAALSDEEHYWQYTIVEAEIPVTDYLGELRLHEISEGDHTLAVWSNQFDVDPDHREELEAELYELFRVGLEALNERFA